MAKFSSIPKLAAAAGVSSRTVAEWVVRPDWPSGVPRKAPWTTTHLAAITAWRANLRPDMAKEAADGAGAAGSTSPELDAKGKPLSWYQVWQRERALKAKLDREEREGELMPAKLLEPALKALTSLFVRELDSAFRALPLQIAGMEPGQVEKVLGDRFRAMRTSLAAQQTLELERIREAPKVKRGKKRGRKPKK